MPCSKSSRFSSSKSRILGLAISQSTSGLHGFTEFSVAFEVSYFQTDNCLFLSIFFFQEVTIAIGFLSIFLLLSLCLELFLAFLKWT